MCKPGQIISLDCFPYRKIDKYVDRWLGKYCLHEILLEPSGGLRAPPIDQFSGGWGEIVGAGASAGLRVILNNRPKM